MEIAVAVILIALLIFCIFMTVVTSKNKKVQKQAMKEAKARGLIQQLVTTHTYGLPVAEGLVCVIQAYKDHVDFISGAMHLTLREEKIFDMCIKAETEIQQHYVSSIGGAVGGAVLFGPLGAAIGGRAKKKTTKTIDRFLIITYQNVNGEMAYLAFCVNACFWQADKLVNEFRQNNTKGGVHIDL